MNREPLQQALDALKQSNRFVWHYAHSKNTTSIAENCNEAIAALEAELAKPEQEPVCYLWVNPETLFYEVDHCNHPLNELIPVYTSPPRKEWVGLTDEEIEQGNKESWVVKQAFQSAVWWAEAKLKEKNNG